ncbi:PREDICTED: liver-expressed antimicrobial peptide 2 [Tinamus guttatus]|uniref:liver-expressed antimicrobial peptide 2 n=1 Tax=Tinamus guttatus TaxID=94827 RepID=UPI00052EC2F7|nr:PREDICTED: liver-expressed antimicrobial peptide 2 [Tinamus guttatus]
MQCWKALALFLLCSLLLSQVSAGKPSQGLIHAARQLTRRAGICTNWRGRQGTAQGWNKQSNRLRSARPCGLPRHRVTPFWRGVALRPVGASCRDSSECVTMLCRKNRCFLRTANE